ncbi:conserved hypothetical protein [Streptomyces sp. C]|nr:conserved hypothetical protein [Streptomyces sp. C]
MHATTSLNTSSVYAQFGVFTQDVTCKILHQTGNDYAETFGSEDDAEPGTVLVIGHVGLLGPVSHGIRHARHRSGVSRRRAIARQHHAWSDGGGTPRDGGSGRAGVRQGGCQLRSHLCGRFAHHFANRGVRDASR